MDDLLCKYANRSTGQLFLQNDALDNCWELWQLVVLRVLADLFFAIIAIFGWSKFLANLINCGSGKFVCKINKLLLRTPFLHVVQIFGFGHFWTHFCKLSLWTTFCLSFTTFQYILLLSLLSSTDKIFYFVKYFVPGRWPIITEIHTPPPPIFCFSVLLLC